ncbi:MAG: thiamine pyrophosphate-dependent dehydrogenase E1 component subunit alpha [Rhodospirillales bacterium]|nr:MAG: thiamine pyrophosphate-dependent dehydrogenase E1 component subunit alpha [Rhodospirillales bacterium]
MTSSLPNAPTDEEGLYAKLLLIRRFEEEIERIYPSDKIKSPVHLSIGQEFIAVGICGALAPEDVVIATYRGHAAYLARGGDLDRFWAELYGKATGCGQGKAGSMHLIDMPVNMVGTSAIVGTSLPIALGYAWAKRQKQEPGLVVCFFGEGATDEGAFHETLNFAALKRLPILFVCENNGLAIYSRTEARVANPDFSARAASYGLTARRIEDGSVFSVRDAARELALGIRDGQSGPCFLEVFASRWRDHVGPGEDFKLGYRQPSELEPWKKNDPLGQLASRIGNERASSIAGEVEGRIAKAIAAAEAAPFPQAGALLEHVYAA